MSRWLQFSLKWLLGVMVAVALCLGTSLFVIRAVSAIGRQIDGLMSRGLLESAGR